MSSTWIRERMKDKGTINCLFLKVWDLNGGFGSGDDNEAIVSYCGPEYQGVKRWRSHAVLYVVPLAVNQYLMICTWYECKTGMPTHEQALHISRTRVLS
jgi:hypothetical protein